MFYIWNKNWHPCGLPPEKKVKMGWRSTANKYSSHTQGSAFASPATSSLAFSAALPPPLCCLALDGFLQYIWAARTSLQLWYHQVSNLALHCCVLFFLSTQHQPRSSVVTALHLHGSMTPEMNIQCFMKFISAAKIVHLLWCNLG